MHFSFMRATLPSYVILLDFIIVIMYNEEKLVISSSSLASSHFMVKIVSHNPVFKEPQSEGLSCTPKQNYITVLNISTKVVPHKISFFRIQYRCYIQNQIPQINPSPRRQSMQSKGD
jgi:hypothetical protein